MENKLHVFRSKFILTEGVSVIRAGKAEGKKWLCEKRGKNQNRKRKVKNEGGLCQNQLRKGVNKNVAEAKEEKRGGSISTSFAWAWKRIRRYWEVTIAEKAIQLAICINHGEHGSN